MSWTTVSKPSTSNYTTVSKPSSSNYTSVAKPTGGGLIEVGFYMGPLGLTYSEQVEASNWTIVPKPL